MRITIKKVMAQLIHLAARAHGRGDNAEAVVLDETSSMLARVAVNQRALITGIEAISALLDVEDIEGARIMIGALEPVITNLNEMNDHGTETSSS